MSLTSIHTSALLVLLCAAFASAAVAAPESVEPVAIAKSAGTESLTTVSREQNLHKRDNANVLSFAANGGYVRYGGFGSNGRVTWAEALMNSDTYRNVQGSNPVTGNGPQSIKPPGWSTIGVTGNSRHRCHMIGAQFGGSGRDARNLFTCHAWANTPTMKWYEDRVKNLLATFPTSGPWKRDKGIKHRVYLKYYPNQQYANSIWIKSDLYMSGQFTHTLQHVRIANRPFAGRAVRYICRGTWPMTGPPSAAGRITTTNVPC